MELGDHAVCARSATMAWQVGDVQWGGRRLARRGRVVQWGRMAKRRRRWRGGVVASSGAMDGYAGHGGWIMDVQAYDADRSGFVGNWADLGNVIELLLLIPSSVTHMGWAPIAL